MSITYDQLQNRLAARFKVLHGDPSAVQDVVVLPSLSLEGVASSSISGIPHYEERLLYTLNLLRFPRTRVIYLTSNPIDSVIVDYFLSLIGGIPAAHMRRRLTMLSARDGSSLPLSEKILARPRLIERIRGSIRADVAHLTCFSVSTAEQELAVKLGIPLYGVHPDLLWLGTKSGSRTVFREAGVDMPPGSENLRDTKDITAAVLELCRQHPQLNRVVVKQNTGFSGQGNAVLDVRGLEAECKGDGELTRRIEKALPEMRFADEHITWPRFVERFEREQGVVEAFLEGAETRTPSGQLRISPLGGVDPVSTHDQIVGGPDGQVYAGCRFPADDEYRQSVTEQSVTVGQELEKHGAVGRFGVDFMCVKQPDGSWRQFAIEINLRLGGTTHPMMLMRMMTNGHYDAKTGLYLTRRGEPQFYTASDSLKSSNYKGLLPEDLLDIAAVKELHYQHWNESGVLFHMMGALSEFGKVGITAIGRSVEEADAWFQRAQDELKAAGAAV